MGSSTTAQSSATASNRLIEAGIDVFGEHSYEAATTRMIAKKAGVNIAAIPYYFNGKEDLTRPFDKVSEGLRRVDTAAREWVGLLAYWLTGRSNALFPAPSAGS